MMQCPFVGEGFGDGILVAGGSLLTLEDFAIESNIRVGLYLYDTQDSGLDTGIDSIVGAPILNAARGLVVNNAYGINFRQGTITPSDLLAKRWLATTTPQPWMVVTARSSLRCQVRLRRLRGD